MSLPWTEKHRPRTLEAMWQTDNVGLKLLQRTLRAGALPPLILAVGEFGIGKTSIGRVIGRRYLCMNPDACEGDPCGSCDGCSRIENIQRGSAFTDGYLELDATEIPARKLVECIYGFVSCYRIDRPPNPNYRDRVICIDEIVHAEATLQSLFVKLTENAKRAKFILCYSDPSKILPALRSRGVQIRLTLPKAKEASGALIKIANAEGYCIDELTARFLAESLSCLPRNCVKALEMAAHFSNGETISLEAVRMAVEVVSQL